MNTNTVFVYGTLKHGYGNWNWALRNRSTFVGVDSILANIYNLGHFPAVTLDGSHPQIVWGEVYTVSDEVLRDLDRLEGYDRPEGHRMYERSQVTTFDGRTVMVYHMPESRMSPKQHLACGYWGSDPRTQERAA